MAVLQSLLSGGLLKQTECLVKETIFLKRAANQGVSLPSLSGRCFSVCEEQYSPLDAIHARTSCAKMASEVSRRTTQEQ